MCPVMWSLNVFLLISFSKFMSNFSPPNNTIFSSFFCFRNFSYLMLTLNLHHNTNSRQMQYFEMMFKFVTFHTYCFHFFYAERVVLQPVLYQYIHERTRTYARTTHTHDVTQDLTHVISFQLIIIRQSIRSQLSVQLCSHYYLI